MDPDELEDTLPAEETESETPEAEDTEGTEAEETPEETEDEPAEGEELESEDEPAPQPSRAASRVQRLAQERTTEREGRLRAEVERDLLNARLTALSAPREDTAATQRQEAEYLATLEPHQQVAYLADKRFKAMEAQLTATKFESVDSADRAAFAARATVNPLYKKYETKVEEELQKFRSQGVNYKREVMLDYLIGKDIRLKSEKEAGKPSAKKQGAQRRVVATATKPAGATGDVAQYGTRRGKTAEERLSNVLI